VSAAETLTDSNDNEYPRNWRWEEDGDTLAGTFVEITEGPTSYGDKPIVVLEVDGERRSIWLFETAVQNRFADEVRKRASGDLTVGERITIVRGEMVTSGTGRNYRAFKVRFPDRPKRKASEILGAPTHEPEPPANESEDDDELPF
jgi:hypothetical protein